MKPLLRRWRGLPFVLVLLAALLAACGEEATPTPSPAPTPTPDPRAILRQAGEAMQALDSVHFAITRSGGPAYLNEEQTLNLSAAEGDYVAPDAVRALLQVSGPGLNLEIQTVAIGEEQWITNPLNQRWDKLPAGFGFNPAILFDPELGWQPLLDKNVEEAMLLADTTVDGEPRRHLRASIAGERVTTLTGGTASSEEPVTVDVWLEAETSRITRLTFTTPSAGEEPSQWEVLFSDFNADVVIEAPEG